MIGSATTLSSTRNTSPNTVTSPTITPHQLRPTSRVYAKALAKAGTLDKKAVRDAIATIEFDSLFAHVKFAENGQIDVPQIAIQIQDGKVVPIFTDHALNKPRYPVPAWGKR